MNVEFIKKTIRENPGRLTRHNLLGPGVGFASLGVLIPVTMSYVPFLPDSLLLQILITEFFLLVAFIYLYLLHLSPLIRGVKELVEENDAYKEAETNWETTLMEKRDLAEAKAALEGEHSETVSYFHSLIEKLKSTSLDISTQSDEIVAIVKSQGQGMGKTAASLQDFTATLSELAKSSKQIADITDEIAQISQETYDLAQSAAQTLDISQQALQNIQKSSSSITQRILDLNEKSKEIGVILEIIESIADKTDILALNAALEGTKAGEAGRGFSLVAKEMRRLSERVTESTGKIKEMIRDIQNAISSSVIATEDGVKTTESGIEVIEKTAGEFEQIFNMVESIKNASAKIALSTNQQKSAAEQSVDSMNEISEVVMQSAMGVREINLALGELNKIANNLKEQIEDMDAPREVRETT